MLRNAYRYTGKENANAIQKYDESLISVMFKTFKSTAFLSFLIFKNANLQFPPITVQFFTNIFLAMVIFAILYVCSFKLWWLQRVK